MPIGPLPHGRRPWRRQQRGCSAPGSAASRKKYDEARRLVQTDFDKLSPAERSAAQRFLVQLSLVERDWQKARTELDGLTDFGPRDLDLLFAYSELAEEQKQPAEVERCLQKFIAMEGSESRYAHYSSGPASSWFKQIPRTPCNFVRAREMIDTPQSSVSGMAGRTAALCPSVGSRGSQRRSHHRLSRSDPQVPRLAGAYERSIDLLSRTGRKAEAETYLGELNEKLRS